MISLRTFFEIRFGWPRVASKHGSMFALVQYPNPVKKSSSESARDTALLFSFAQ